MEQQSSLKVKIQKLGTTLSNMVMPNIGAFIAWGVITALFIEAGYLPNEKLATIVGLMLTYLLPILIGYTGGYNVYGQRGGVVGAIATFDAVAGSTVPMFIGAMIMGPLGGWLIKKFDEKFQSKIPTGFEMLVNNFSAGLIGFGLVLIAFFAIGPVVATLTGLVGDGVQAIVDDVVRVARTPIRKLGYDERFIRPIRELKDRGLDYSHLLQTVAYVFHYQDANDEQSLELQQLLAQETLEDVIAKVTGLSDQALITEIADSVKRLEQ